MLTGGVSVDYATNFTFQGASVYKIKAEFYYEINFVKTAL